MRGKNALYIFAILLVFLGSTGCEKQPDGNLKTVASDVSPEAETEVSKENFSGEANVTLSLAPKVPTVNTDIKALLHGSVSAQEWRWEVNGEKVEEAVGALLPKEFFRKGDLVTATVLGNGVETTVSTRVGNSPPRVLSVPLVNSAIHRGVDIKVEPKAVDDDGDNIDFRYVWMLNGETLPWIDGPLLAGEEFQKGDIIKLTVIPFDEVDEGLPFNGLEFEIPNAPPVFVSSPPEVFKEVEYRYQVRVEDPDEEQVVCQLKEGPAGMSMNADNGLISWSIPEGLSGEFRVRIEACDPEGMKAYQEYTMQISRGE